MKNPQLGGTLGFSAVLLLLLKMKCVCGLTVISVAGGVCRPYRRCCASCVFGRQFRAGTLQSTGRVAGMRAGGTLCFWWGDRGGGSLQGSGCQHDASALDRNLCPSGQEVTISASLQHGPPQGKSCLLLKQWPVAGCAVVYGQGSSSLILCLCISQALLKINRPSGSPSEEQLQCRAPEENPCPSTVHCSC